MREGSEGQAWDGDGMEVEKERGPVVTHGTGPTTRRRATRAQLIPRLNNQNCLFKQQARNLAKKFYCIFESTRAGYTL